MKEQAKLEKSERKKRKKLNSEIMTTTIIFALIFFVMIGYYVYFLVVESHDVVNNDYNKRIDGYEIVGRAFFAFGINNKLSILLNNFL